MTIAYYEVYANSPYMNNGDIYYNTELMNRYSTREKAVNALRRWAEIKGIPFTENHHEVNEFDVKDIVGLFYDVNNEPVSYTKKWEYGTYAYVMKVELVLDKE